MVGAGAPEDLDLAMCEPDSLGGVIEAVGLTSSVMRLNALRSIRPYV